MPAPTKDAQKSQMGTRSRITTKQFIETFTDKHQGEALFLVNY